MGNTLLQIDIRVIQNMWIDSDSTTYSKENRRVPKINSVISRICKGNYKNILTWQIYKGWDMWFLRKKEFVQSFEAIKTTEKIDSTNTTVACTTTAKIPTQWHINVNWCVFQYTGKTANSLTGVTGIVWVHPNGSNMQYVHKVASDCMKPHNLFYIQQETGKTLPRDFLDYKYQDVSDNYWTLIIDDVWEQYIHCNFPTSEENYWHIYYKKPTILTWDTDVTDIPDDYGVELIALLASWEMLRETEQRDQWKNQLTLAYAMLEEFNNNFIEQTKQYRKTIRRIKETNNAVYFRRR